MAADPKHLGARIGVLMVLHTWGQKLEHHPHVHCVVPGGGLAIPAKSSGSTATVPGDQVPRWVSCRPNWFLPVRVLGQVFRGKYLAALRTAYQAGQLQFAGSTLPLASPAAWATSIRALYQKDWVVYAKEPFGGPEQVLKYLTGYTHRVALSNHRLVKLRDDRVTFTWKDYADSCRRKEMTLEAVEFVAGSRCTSYPKGWYGFGSMDFWLTAIAGSGWRCAGRCWRPAPDRHRHQRPTRRRRVPVPDRRTATRHRVGRDQRRLRSSPSRQRHLGWVSPSWWSWFRSWSHRGTRPRSPHPRLCRQPRVWSTIAARVVAWVTYKRSGKPADPAG